MLHAKCVLSVLTECVAAGCSNRSSSHTVLSIEIIMSGKNKSYVPELTEKQQNPVFVYSENSQI